MLPIPLSSVKLGQLSNTRSTGHEGNATMFVLNKHRDPRVEGLNYIDEETKGVLDTTLKLGENDEERMVNL